MKIILSRKGFDSSAGGCPSPILPDGRLLSLPIPDEGSNIHYGDLPLPDGLIRDLSRGKLSLSSGAHLDPDVVRQSLKRKRDWRPLFGQHGAAQSHLRNQGVDVSDLFLFFGLFRRVIHEAGRWHWDQTAQPRHILWGWFQVAEIINLTDNTRLPRWAHYHPHCGREDFQHNTLYVPRAELQLGPAPTGIPGAGIFPRYSPVLQLTAPNANAVSHWQLPRWFYPSQGKPSLSYHQRLDRWQRCSRWTTLQAAARGQEFVLDTTYYPKARPWAKQLIEDTCGLEPAC